MEELKSEIKCFIFHLKKTITGNYYITKITALMCYNLIKKKVKLWQIKLIKMIGLR